MGNKIIRLLLLLCLTACLSVNTNAATASASVTLAGSTLEIKNYDTPVYYANAATEDPGEENWNAKLIWHADEDLPTLYLKGFSADDPTQTAIVIPAGQPMRIVITGNSQINAQFGIVYQSDLEIVSEGQAKLTIQGLSGAITGGTATGCKLTIDANLDLSVKSYYDASSHILQTNKADLTINGGNIKISTDEEKSLFGIVTRNAGNIVINGGNLEVNSSIGAAPTNGSIHSNGKLIINGGAIKATAKAAVPLYAKEGIEITGGQVDINSPYYGINAGTPESPTDISIKGGTVKIAANRAFFTYPLLGEGVFAYAGTDEDSAEVYDGSFTALAKEPWMLISNDPNLERATEPTAAPTEPTAAAPTVAPTTLPTTVLTQAPTTPPTEASTQPSADIATAPAGSPLLIWFAVAGAIGLVGIGVTLIL